MDGFTALVYTPWIPSWMDGWTDSMGRIWLIADTLSWTNEVVTNSDIILRKEKA